MQSKTLAIISLLVAAIAGLGYVWYAVSVADPHAWKSSGLAATYAGTELREVDGANASLFLYYEVENKTDLDYHLADTPRFPVMSRLASDGTLSSQEDVRLGYPTFLPAGQKARVALELRHRFAWPAGNDPQLQDKVREFVNQRLVPVNEFVLFDQDARVQIEFPRGWQELQLASAGTH
jgi:hypothetical protein